MKITKNQLRGWIKEALNEMEDEESTEEPSHIDATDIEDNPFDIDVKEGGKGSGRPAKPGGAKDTENKMMSAADAANAKMDAAEKAMKDKKKKKKTNESVSRRFTVKEVKTWMRTLEENRYKKTYNSDCRRVAWMVNNIGENIKNMPVSMSKKWSKAQYGRERYLAKEFIKSKKSEQKLRESIRNIIKGKLTEAKTGSLTIPIKDKLKVDKILKKSGGKIGKNYDIAGGKSGTFVLNIDVKLQDKVLELLMKNNIKVRG